VRSYEIPRAVFLESGKMNCYQILIEEPFTVTNGKLTSTMKTCRHQLIKFYANEVQQMYEEVEEIRRRV
jgi:long-subunit acyl-CoA synthetase (AMP-forming)